MKNELEIARTGDIFKKTDRPDLGTTNFMSWERLCREHLNRVYKDARIVGFGVSERGLEIRLELLSRTHQ